MRFRHRAKRGLAVGLLGALAVVSAACGGGGSEPVGIGKGLSMGQTQLPPNRVGFVFDHYEGDDLVFAVAVGGPTSSSDLYGFAFDIVLNESASAVYVEGSASAGEALTPGPGQGLLVQVVAEGNRIVVGISKSGAGPGNGIQAPYGKLLRLRMRRVGPGSTTLVLEGAPLPQGGSAPPSAVDSHGNVVPSIDFSGTGLINAL